MSNACEVPFIEQLLSVPQKARLTLEIQWDDSGNATGYQFIPVGHMMHKAALVIHQLETEIAQLKAKQQFNPIEYPLVVSVYDDEVSL